MKKDKPEEIEETEEEATGPTWVPDEKPKGFGR